MGFGVDAGEATTGNSDEIDRDSEESEVKEKLPWDAALRVDALEWTDRDL
jgi:hypothetical protein